MNTSENPSKETLEKWHKDSKNWKMGLFYFNPEDKRLLPPKRIAWMGLTVNFANTKSVLLFSSLLILAIIVIVFKKY